MSSVGRSGCDERMEGGCVASAAEDVDVGAEPGGES